MSDQVATNNTAFSPKEGILLIVGFIVVSVAFATFVALVNSYPATTALPALSIAGIVLLLLCLAGISYVFARMGLTDKSQALGLPPGSIQSVIALSLIVLFAILSVFVFTSMAGPSTFRELKNLNVADRDKQITQLGLGFAGWQEQATPGQFTVYVRDVGAEARNDVGKQLIVLIGTLMTSAVSFYFGTRAAVAGGAAVGAAIAAGATDAQKDMLGRTEATITRIEPQEGLSKSQPKPVLITGTNLSRATSVAIKLGINTLETISVKPTPTGLQCDFAPVTVPAGTYDVEITASGKMIAALKAGLMVIE